MIGTRAEINLNAAANNVRELRRITRPDARLMAVVKADGYGHGARKIAETALQHGAAELGVARLEEGIHLREAGITAPILVFGYTPPEQTGQLIAHDLTQTVGYPELAGQYADAANRLNGVLKIHLEIDTGMGRLGFPAVPPESEPGQIRMQPAVRAIQAVIRLPGLSIQGIFTHFACADHADKTHAHRQFMLFQDLLGQLAQTEAFEIPLRHAANSAAIIDLPETHLDMVRAGISLYGLYPSDAVDHTRIALQPVMTLKSNIIHLKNVPKGFSISYGATWIAPRNAVIATIPVGYADGYSRRLSSTGHMLVCGKKAPIVGRVCMDLVMLDVTDIPEAGIHDEVIVFGGQSKGSLPVDEIAGRLGTINYEIVSAITGRVPRIYRLE